MSIKNNINKIEALYRKGEFEQSLELSQELIKKKPKLFNALQLLALNYQALNRLDIALTTFQKAIKINDKHASTFNNIGNIYFAQGKFKEAKKYFGKALSIEPLMPEATNNLATCQSKFGDFQSAEDNYKKAILLEGNRADFYVNLGELLAEQGKFDNATEVFLKSLGLDKSKGAAYWHIFKIFMYRHRYEDALEIADIALQSTILSEPELCEILIGKAMLFWLFYNPEEGEQAIHLSEAVHQYKDKSRHMANMAIFHNYLKMLFKIRKAQPSLYIAKENTSYKDIYFVSESHGFAPNNTFINYKNEDYQVRSLFVFGAKVFHIINERDNKFKESLLTLFNGLPIDSKVVIGFGEIDCRSNEGIFTYCKKSGKDFNTVIEHMIQKYISILKALAVEKNIEVIIYGVPAPHPSQIEQLLEEHDKAEFKEVLKLLNETLSQECQNEGISFLDVYQLTNEQGISNLAYHIDAIHLKPETVPELFSLIA